MKEDPLRHDQKKPHMKVAKIKQFAIIAAGEGSRLQQEGIETPKPLVLVNGETLIDRLIRIFINQGAEKIIIAINSIYSQVEQHLKRIALQTSNCKIEWVVANTPSSMHSFYALSHLIDDAPFCLTTVDTIFTEQDFAKYLNIFEQSEHDGVMAVTDFIDDEKPLYVEVTQEHKILNFHDTSSNCHFISGGIYGLKSNAIKTLKHCIETKQFRMRNFQRALIADGLYLQAYPFSKILDVDHAEDINKAESFLQQT
jgi:NDP-sugar pyrophosphorylase family protein